MEGFWYLNMNMTSEYTAEDLLPISGIQHFLFCRRQWALIHIENQWKENQFTAEGHILHEQVDDPYFTESRRNMFISRSVPVSSYRLGLTGICDVVEFMQDSNGVFLPQKESTYQPYPVEYKRGKPKREPVDEVQLCAQAICLEEMLSVSINEGAIYYGQTRHREPIRFTKELRLLVQKLSEEMHEYFTRKYTPKVKPTKACRSCSLNDICLPDILNKREKVSTYISNYLGDLQ